MSYSSNVTFQNRLLDQTATTLSSSPKLTDQQKTDISSDAAQLQSDTVVDPTKVAADTAQLANDVYSAEKSGGISQQQGKYLLSPATAILADSEVESGGSNGAKSLADFFNVYCQNNNLPNTGKDFSSAWDQFDQTLKASFPNLDTQFAATVSDAKQRAQTQLAPSTGSVASSGATASTQALTTSASTASTAGTASTAATASTAGTASTAATVSTAGTASTAATTSTAGTASTGMTASTGKQATGADLFGAVVRADVGYAIYESAKNDPNVSAADKQTLANQAFGKMERGFEVAANLGLNYDQFATLMSTAMPSAASTAAAYQGQPMPDTNYKVNIDPLQSENFTQDLNTWLNTQTDLDTATMAADQAGGPETKNQGANFGTATVKAWTQDAATFDQGQDPFANPALTGSVPSAQ